MSARSRSSCFIPVTYLLIHLLPNKSPCQGVVGACDHALGVRRGWRGKVATESQSVNSASSALISLPILKEPIPRPEIHFKSLF